MRHKRRRGFTLIEVLAAIVLIVVLTVALVATINSQVQQANRQNNRILVETVNAQLVITAQQVGWVKPTSTQDLVTQGIISKEQLDRLTGTATFDLTSDPPQFRIRP
ncbi:type II secretion system protein [Lacticaseibacillus mingshuiensis]|uniref:Type II secretion system protein n=1 Tax=Lacticaseibacillus mingshuiensis TaxID=2799574 RepID=A0ABW4CLP2_9LACO|nr:type II secretion system protein [Lacticaseibacillus mingshuiensis]